MWSNIAHIAREAGCTLTVYMDDVTLSGDAVPERVVWAVRKQIHCRGLHYHKEKHFAQGIAEVTGTLIKNGRMVVPNRQHKKAYETRMELALATDPTTVSQLTSRLRGLSEQRRQVER